MASNTSDQPAQRAHPHQSQLIPVHHPCRMGKCGPPAATTQVVPLLLCFKPCLQTLEELLSPLLELQSRALANASARLLAWSTIKLEMPNRLEAIVNGFVQAFPITVHGGTNIAAPADQALPSKTLSARMEPASSRSEAKVLPLPLESFASEPQGSEDITFLPFRQLHFINIANCSITAAVIQGPSSSIINTVISQLHFSEHLLDYSVTTRPPVESPSSPSAAPPTC